MMMKRNFLVLALAVAGNLALTPLAAAVEITGAGATFPYPVYAKWADTYHTRTGVKMNYQSIGSGGGIKQIQAKTVDFGASDKPLTLDELEKHGLIQFPTVIGGVVPVINVPGVQPGSIRLTGTLLADIFLGKISNWNDSRLAALNKGVKLPDLPISVIRRSDGSGTTFIFTDYLSKVSPDWRTKVGADASVAWPTGIGGKGNEGVASYVQRVKGGIGYVEYAYALQNKMTYVGLQNRDGAFVTPNEESFAAAAANADWDKAPGFYEILTNEPGAKSWPITGATFILVHKQQASAAKGAEVLKFFDWAYREGDALASNLDYIPMPDRVVQKIQASWRTQVKDANGTAVWR